MLAAPPSALSRRFANITRTHNQRKHSLTHFSRTFRMLCCCAPTSKQLLTVEQPGKGEAHSQTSPIEGALLAAAAEDEQAASEAALSTKGEEVAIKERELCAGAGLAPGWAPC